MKEFYGFIYLTICLINGKMYVGKKKYSGSWKTYLGSGKHFKNALRKYGRENFVRLILENCKTKKELSDTEKEYISLLNAVDDKMFYNLAEGGEGGNVSLLFDDKKKKVIVNNSLIFDSILEAAEYIGTTNSNLARALKNYHEVNGFEVWLEEDLDNYKPLEYFRSQKHENISSSQTKRLDLNKIVMMPNKIIFKNISECLEYVGGTKNGLWNRLSFHKNGFSYMGYELILEKYIDDYKTPQERKEMTRQKRSSALKGKECKNHFVQKIKCTTDDMIFNSIKDASLY